MKFRFPISAFCFSAQAVPSATSLGFWISLFANLALIVSVIVMITRKKETRTIKPQPLMIQHADQPVSESDCIARHSESTRQISHMENQLTELRTLRVQDTRDSSESRTKMYNALRDLRLELTDKQDKIRDQMAKGLQDIERTLGRLEGKINGIS